MSLKIIGTGKAVPEKTVTNCDLSTFLDTDDTWITTRTGIKARHVCTTETMTDLSARAAAKALEKAGLTAADIDLIICSTISGDYITPSEACAIQAKIGARCPAFDINAACSGFLYALDLAALYLDAGRAQNVLIVCAEVMSKHVDWTDRRTCVLFGDGAGACVVTKGIALQYLQLYAAGDVETIYLHTSMGNSPFAQRLPADLFLHMEGGEVYKFAVTMVEQQAREAAQALGLSPDNFDYFLLHQANQRIIDTARAKLKQPPEKFPGNIQHYGNMSSASIPVLLDELLEQGAIKPGDRLFLSAFGAGMTAGCCVLEWE